jgi:hypothetical protein
MSSPAVDDPDIAPKLDPAVPPEASRRSNRAARAGRLLLTAAHEHEAGAAKESWRVDLWWSRSRTGRETAGAGNDCDHGRRPAKAARQKVPPFCPSSWWLAGRCQRRRRAGAERRRRREEGDVEAIGAAQLGTPGNGGAGAAPPPAFPLSSPAIPLPLSAYICSSSASLSLNVSARTYSSP